jgi:hypothetical protein
MGDRDMKHKIMNLVMALCAMTNMCFLSANNDVSFSGPLKKQSGLSKSDFKVFCSEAVVLFQNEFDRRLRLAKNSIERKKITVEYRKSLKRLNALIEKAKNNPTESDRKQIAKMVRSGGVLQQPGNFDEPVTVLDNPKQIINEFNQKLTLAETPTKRKKITAKYRKRLERLNALIENENLTKLDETQMPVPKIENQVNDFAPEPKDLVDTSKNQEVQAQIDAEKLFTTIGHCQQDQPLFDTAPMTFVGENVVSTDGFDDSLAQENDTALEPLLLAEELNQDAEKRKKIEKLNHEKNLLQAQIDMQKALDDENVQLSEYQETVLDEADCIKKEFANQAKNLAKAQHDEKEVLRIAEEAVKAKKFNSLQKQVEELFAQHELLKVELNKKLVEVNSLQEQLKHAEVQYAAEKNTAKQQVAEHNQEKIVNSISEMVNGAIAVLKEQLAVVQAQICEIQKQQDEIQAQQIKSTTEKNAVTAEQLSVAMAKMINTIPDVVKASLPTGSASVAQAAFKSPSLAMPIMAAAAVGGLCAAGYYGYDLLQQMMQNQKECLLAQLDKIEKEKQELLVKFYQLKNDVEEQRQQRTAKVTLVQAVGTQTEEISKINAGTQTVEDKKPIIYHAAVQTDRVLQSTSVATQTDDMQPVSKVDPVIVPLPVVKCKDAEILVPELEKVVRLVIDNLESTERARMIDAYKNGATTVALASQLNNLMAQQKEHVEQEQELALQQQAQHHQKILAQRVEIEELARNCIALYEELKSMALSVDMVKDQLNIAYQADQTMLQNQLDQLQSKQNLLMQELQDKENQLKMLQAELAKSVAETTQLNITIADLSMTVGLNQQQHLKDLAGLKNVVDGLSSTVQNYQKYATGAGVVTVVGGLAVLAYQKGWAQKGLNSVKNLFGKKEEPIKVVPPALKQPTPPAVKKRGRKGRR